VGDTLKLPDGGSLMVKNATTRPVIFSARQESGDMRFLTTFFALAIALALAQPPQDPKVMRRVEVFLEGPDIPARSFATKPKVMYRAGTRYCRTEEAPDPENGIHGLAIVNEPDFWLVNLL